jgi:hypothetical protein
MLIRIIKKLLEWILGAIISKGALEALHMLDYYPDLCLAKIISNAPSQINTSIGWLLVGVGSIIIVSIWHLFDIGNKLKALDIFRGTFNKTSPIPDKELNQIRRDALWLKETALTYSANFKPSEEYYERLSRLSRSDHLVWTNDKLRERRQDFIHSVSWLMEMRKILQSAKEARDLRTEINDRWKALENELQLMSR